MGRRPIRLRTRSFLMECLRKGADRSFEGFDSNIHGLGHARYKHDVALDVARHEERQSRVADTTA
jgi:hypothetical protein